MKVRTHTFSFDYELYPDARNAGAALHRLLYKTWARQVEANLSMEMPEAYELPPQDQVRSTIADAGGQRIVTVSGTVLVVSR